MKPVLLRRPTKPLKPRAVIFLFQWLRQLCERLKQVGNLDGETLAARTTREKPLTELQNLLENCLLKGEWD